MPLEPNMKTQTENLIHMANQIAHNNGHWPTETECVDRVTQHIKRFWAPSMIEKLKAQPAEQIAPLAQKAMEQL